MKIAFFSDIHANLQALTACLAHAQRQGAQQMAFLGDLVGYGADPVAVLDLIIEHAQAGAWVVKGNHDEMALAAFTASHTMGGKTAAWTQAQLGSAHRAFLDGLPLTSRHGHLLLVHASADQPEKWHYVQEAGSAMRSLEAACRLHADVRYVFGGHVHAQTLYYRGATGGLMPFAPTPGVAVPVPSHRAWLATVGSVGQPRDGNPQAMYALMDSERCQLTFHRIDYDHQAAAAAILKAGLPDFFANRLEQGR